MSVPPHAVLLVRVTPKASSERLVLENGRLRVWVNAPPAEGVANAAVTALLAKKFGVPISAVSIARGRKDRNKQVKELGLTQEALEQLIKERLT